jgi:hypothetical protein
MRVAVRGCPGGGDVLGRPPAVIVINSQQVNIVSEVIIQALGGDDEKAARILGVTVGSARLAKRRQNAPEIDHRQNAS